MRSIFSKTIRTLFLQLSQKTKKKPSVFVKTRKNGLKIMKLLEQNWSEWLNLFPAFIVSFLKQS